MTMREIMSKSNVNCSQGTAGAFFRPSEKNQIAGLQRETVLSVGHHRY